MQIIKGKTSFDFIGKRKIALFISSILNISILIGIAIFGFNFGVDFQGGTLVEVKFKASTTAEQVREGAIKGGLQEPQVQGIGSAEENNFILRMGGVTQLTEESEKAAEAAVRGLGEVVSLTKNLDTGIINVRYKSPIDPATSNACSNPARASGSADRAAALFPA